MKKSFLFVAVLAMTFAACNKNEPEKTLAVADFESINLASESVYHITESGTFESGDFIFQQQVQDYGGGAIYYMGNIVSSKTSNEYKGDYQNDMSASGGAHTGDKFVVWTISYSGLDSIFLKEAAIVPGFYVNNTPWVVDGIKNGDRMSDDGGKPFGENDFFTLTVHGSLNGKAVNNEVTVELAKGTSYIKDWTYVDLRSLGKVDAIKFSMSGSKKNDRGLTTPAYFAMDDFGATK